MAYSLKLFCFFTIVRNIESYSIIADLDIPIAIRRELLRFSLYSAYHPNNRLRFKPDSDLVRIRFLRSFFDTGEVNLWGRHFLYNEEWIWRRVMQMLFHRPYQSATIVVYSVDDSPVNLCRDCVYTEADPEDISSEQMHIIVRHLDLYRFVTRYAHWCSRCNRVFISCERHHERYVYLILYFFNL